MCFGPARAPVSINLQQAIGLARICLAEREIMRLLAAIILLSLSVGASAGVYAVKPAITNDELMGLYKTMLSQYCLFAESKFKVAPFDASAGYWGNGVSGSNEGIRAVANTALVYAVSAKEIGLPSARLRSLYIRRATAGIRYVTSTHLTDRQVCTDGKNWGNSWQSAMWTGTVCMAAWIVWDELDADTQALVKRVAEYEANRFLAKTPPGNEWGDTKAEENGWDLTCIAAAANMFPDHPNADKWRTKCIEYMMNTVSVAADQHDSTIVDGRPVKDWVCTVNYHPDFSLDNHGFFHPSYTMVSPAEVGTGAIFFAYGGRPVPDASGHHLADTWNCLQTIMLPHGYWAYTQGMDWALNSDGHTHYLAFLASYGKDPLALGMEKIVAQYVRGHQMLYGGKFAGPSSRLGFARDAITAERLCYAYLMHQLFGFADSERTIRAADELLGVRHYQYAEMTSHRTRSKFASFSWKNRVMGLVMPIGPGHEASPYFTTPLTDGLVGSIVCKDLAGASKIEKQNWRKTADGFETSGAVMLNDGALRQDVRFASIGEKTVVYTDRITALRDVTVTREHGLPVGIQNDEYTGNARTLYHQSGSKTIVGLGTEELRRVPGNWANVDGRLGVVVVSGSGIAYQDVKTYNRDGALQDTLFGSFSDAPRSVKAGEEAARRIAVMFTDVSAGETARLAREIRVEKTPTGSILRLVLPEGGERRVAL